VVNLVRVCHCGISELICFEAICDCYTRTALSSLVISIKQTSFFRILQYCLRTALRQTNHSPVIYLFILYIPKFWSLPILYIRCFALSKAKTSLSILERSFKIFFSQNLE
jgi:hypothetical protein